VSERVRIYINAKGIDVLPATTVLGAVEEWDAHVAAEIRSGEKMITDSRGLRAEPESPVHNGAIFRVVRARQEAPDTP
jgi:hypothetical protein